jgi:hypothetical protein
MATSKLMTQKDEAQAIRSAYIDDNGTISVDGFLAGKVGRRVDVAISTTTIANDTSTFSFSENGTPILALQLVYTDGTQSQLLYAVRIS